MFLIGYLIMILIPNFWVLKTLFKDRDSNIEKEGDKIVGNHRQLKDSLNSSSGQEM